MSVQEICRGEFCLDLLFLYPDVAPGGVCQALDGPLQILGGFHVAKSTACCNIWENLQCYSLQWGKINTITIIKIPRSQFLPFPVPHCSRTSSGCRTGSQSPFPSCSIIPATAADLPSSSAGFVCLFTFHYPPCFPYFEVSR